MRFSDPTIALWALTSMIRKTKSSVAGVLLGAVSGCAACALLAFFFFPSHIALAAILGAVVGALAGAPPESVFEAAVDCLICGVMVAFLVYASLKPVTPNPKMELFVVMFASVLLGVGVGKLGASLTKGL